ncbi:MAG TPA: DUF3291 domain-containing protein [Aggregatilineales bacterium]|nr:DUF3291 domain-containing protein [Anaerolineales bacterium]HRE46733.1 DUF3291 domain-containing protein [Aggregatilineales bacterium]
MSIYHLAQLNIATLRVPTTDPMIADFMTLLDHVNALAEQTPGFVWRFKTEGGSAVDAQFFENPLVIINFSVWETIDALFAFTYNNPDHLGVFRRRLEWFEKHEAPSLVMWWIPAGTTPTVEEGKKRLALLREKGTTADAFTFKQRFPPPAP